MDLISYKNSWNLIQNLFKNYYDNNNLEVDLFNIKSTLFTQHLTKTIVYIDTFKKEGQYYLPIFVTQDNTKNILVLNNTVTELPYSSLLIWNYFNSFLVFKHSAVELSNIICTKGEATSITSANIIFTRYKKVYVPVGLRNDYITFFSNMTNWDPAYADQIVEGDEYDIE